MSTVNFRQCPLCGDSGPSVHNAIVEYEVHVPGAGVCAECADRIANAYSMKHSGQWLTWPNRSVPTTKTKKVSISRSIRTKVFERDQYRCLRCGTHKSLRADHIVPESQGGLATLENLQTLCQPCNSWKGTRTIDFRRGA